MVNISSFDLNLLRVLDALLREPSTTRAGQRIGLSQPAVSAALGRLRAALGDELFYRQGKGLAPTEHALSLQAPLARIMAEIEAILAGSATFDPATATDTFRISGSDFFADLLMPRMAARLQRTAPGVSVHLVNLVPDNYVEALNIFEVELALIPQIDLPDWAESQVVLHGVFDVVARKGHPRLANAGLSPGDTIPLDLYCDIGHVRFSPSGDAHGLGDTALARVGRKRRVAMTMPVFSGVCRAVAGSDLIALIPRQLAEHIADSVGLDVFRLPIPIEPVPIAMVWNRRYSASPAHVWLRGEVADLLAPLDIGGPP